MSAVAAPLPITVEEFLELPDRDRYEVIDGELRGRKEMSLESSKVAAKAVRYLDIFSDDHGGDAFGSDAIFRAFGESGEDMRRPDASYVVDGRIEDITAGVGWFAPDLAVEVVSPNDSAYDVADKVADYRRAGVRMIWVVWPSTREVEVIEGGRREWLSESDTITGSDILPGFELPVAKLFAK